MTDLPNAQAGAAAEGVAAERKLASIPVARALKVITRRRQIISPAEFDQLATPDGFRGALAHWSGNDDAALRLLEPAAPVWREFWGTWCLPLDTLLAATLLRTGRTADALHVLDAAQQLATSSNAPWWRR